MKTAVVFIILIICLSQTMAWNDGLWGRELRKRVKPKIDAEAMKLAEEIINQQRFFGKGRKVSAKLHNDNQLREVEES